MFYKRTVMWDSSFNLISVIYSGFLLISFFVIRCLYLIWKVKNGFVEKPKSPIHEVKCMIVIGSGGHTAEMLKIVSALDAKKYEKFYMVAKSDSTSRTRITDLETQLASNKYSVIMIPRSREVHQSFFTSIFTTLYSIIYCFPVLLKLKPDLVLCNGPGTCIPVCFIALLLRTLFLTNSKIVFIESLCRVKTMSLTGSILLYIADEILVQWPELTKIHPRLKYVGRL